MVTKYQNQEPPGEDDTLYITVPARRQSSGQRSKNGSPQRSATDIPSPRSSSRSSPTNRSASRITSNITSPTGQSFTSTSSAHRDNKPPTSPLGDHSHSSTLYRQSTGSSDKSSYSNEESEYLASSGLQETGSQSQSQPIMDKSLARPNEKQQISSTPQVSTNKPSSPPLGNATPPSASRSPLVGEAPSEQTGHHTQNSAESSSGFHDGASSEALGHSREPSTILPLPPLAATLPPGSTSGPPEEKLHHKLRESPNNDEEYDIMTEIENAIQAANQGESSPNAASMRSGLSSQQDQQQHGMAISTPGLGDKTFDFGSTLTKGEEPPSPPFEPASTTESKDHEAEAPLEREKESDASKMPISMAPTPASPTQDLKSSLRSPSLYSNASFSRTDGQNKKSNARRQSSYTAREEPSIRVLTPSIKAPWATAARLVSIRKQNGDMSWAGWRDVTKLKTSGERAVAYAHKINTLGQTTSGLAMWIALKQVIPNDPSTPANVRRGSDSGAWIAGGHTPSRSGSFRSSRPHLRTEPSMEFRMRPDASKATDLTSYATQTAPSSFTPTNVPYPGVVHPKRSASSSASGFSIQKPASTSSSRSPRFFSLARRASARSGPSSQSKAPSATSSQQLYSLNRPGMQVGGPRNSLAPSEGSHHSSRPSTQNSVSNEEIAKLGDVLPHARKDQLGAYIRKANGDSTLALQCFLEDERTGQLLC